MEHSIKKNIVEMIVEIQQQLKDLGFAVEQHGFIDSNTVNAVNSFASKTANVLTSKVLPKSLLPTFDTYAKPFVSWEEIKQAISETDATTAEGDMLSQFFRFENKHSSKGINVEMKIPFVGLGQFDRATWKSVSNKPYEYAADTVSSIEATLALLRANRRSYTRQFGRTEGFTPYVAYLYHQQGASRAKRILQRTASVRGNQSKESLAAFDKNIDYTLYA